MKKLSLSLMILTIMSVVGCGTGTPQVVDAYIHCRSLSGDRTALKLFAWEFDAVSEEINSYCTEGMELTENEIVAEVSKRLKPELRDSLKDAQSSIKVTLLELEVRGVYVKTPDDEKGDAKFRRT